MSLYAVEGEKYNLIHTPPNFVDDLSIFVSWGDMRSSSFCFETQLGQDECPEAAFIVPHFQGLNHVKSCYPLVI